MDHRHDATFAPILRNLYSDLQLQLITTRPHGPMRREVSGSRFLCVWNGLQDHLDGHQLRKHIENLLGLGDVRIIQVVGDSNSQFAPAGIERVKNVLEALLNERLPEERHTVFEYGYTAGKHDTNWIVNDMIASNPGLGARTIANIVGMSARAVEDWGTEATSLLRNFALAYDEMDTAFGSDMWLSDNIMFPSHGDKLVCVEGGPQAFAQAISVCSRGVPVIAVTGADLREKSSASLAARFSAAHLLRILKEWEIGSSQATCIGRKELDSRAAARTYVDGCFKLDDAGDLRKYGTIVTALEIALSSTDIIAIIKVIAV